MLEDRRRKLAAAASHVMPEPHWGSRDQPALPKRRCILRDMAPSQPPPLVAASTPWTLERAAGGPSGLLPRAAFLTPEEHNRFREMELFMRSPQPLPIGLSSQFVPRIKVELPEPPESPLRRLHTDCGGVVGLGNCDDRPLDVRIHPRSPNCTSSASNGGVGGCVNKATPTTTTVGGAPMVDNGEVEEIVANVELADDSTGDVLDDRNSSSGGAAAAGRMPYASARAVAERQLVELQRIQAEEEHKSRMELLKKQHAVADLQRKYWHMKVKAFAQKVHHGDNKSIGEDSDSAD